MQLAKDVRSTSNSSSRFALRGDRVAKFTFMFELRIWPGPHAHTTTALSAVMPLEEAVRSTSSNSSYGMLHGDRGIEHSILLR